MLDHQKIAVIDTTQARDTSKDHRSFSPSKLLLALKEQGFTVVVVTTRSRLFDEDKEWSHLVDHIFFPVGPETVGDASDPSYIRAYEMMFAEFGLSPPINPAYWTNWKDAANDQCGIRAIYKLIKG